MKERKHGNDISAYVLSNSRRRCGEYIAAGNVWRRRRQANDWFAAIKFLKFQFYIQIKNVNCTVSGDA